MELSQLPGLGGYAADDWDDDDDDYHDEAGGVEGQVGPLMALL